MKKGVRIFLYLALLAALPAQAVYVNPRGTGQVLLFPYYTANAGQSTVLRIANTTARAKQLSLRVREGYNSREVLQFRISLGPHDAWSGTIRSDGDKMPASVYTADSSCTAPDKSNWNATPGGGWDINVFHWAYTAGNIDGGPTTPARSREGYIEVIEVAELQGALAAAATSGATRNCVRLWDIDTANPDLLVPGGGLSGQFAIVDTAVGTYMAGKATALDDFSQLMLLSDFGTPPSLEQANNAPGEAHADFLQNGGSAHLRYSTIAPNNAIDAVSAVLAAGTVSADIAADAAAGSFTEWVITLPTKFRYTDNQVLGLPVGGAGAVAPFEQTFSEVHNGASCSRFEAQGYTDEGAAVSFDPAAAALPLKSLCHAVNVLSFGPLAANASTPVLRSRLGSSLWNPQPAFSSGRVELDFGKTNSGQARLLRPSLVDNVAVRGLPLIGFAAYRYTHAAAMPGLLQETLLQALTDRTVSCVNAQSGALCP